MAVKQLRQDSVLFSPYSSYKALEKPSTNFSDQGPKELLNAFSQKLHAMQFFRSVVKPFAWPL